MSVWKLIAHHESPREAFDLFRETDRIAIGWNRVGDLKAKQPGAAPDITNWIQDKYPNLDNSGLGGPSLWRFYAHAKERDLVLVSGGGRRYGVFQIAGPYEFVEEVNGVLGYQHVRKAIYTRLDANDLWAWSGRDTAPGENHMWTMAKLHLNPFEEQRLTQALQNPVPGRYWLNVDQRKWRQMLHIEEACGDVRQKGQYSKEVGKLSASGGWFEFRSMREATINAQSRLGDGFGPITFCRNCRKAHAWFDSIGAASIARAERVPAARLAQVTAEHLWNAIKVLEKDGALQPFGESTDYDLLLPSGLRLAPEAVFGLAATEALGFEVRPGDFSGALGTQCFRALEEAGYQIVPKHVDSSIADDASDSADREWAEGSPKVRTHLRRERAAGLSAAKRAQFRRLHEGRLFCEKCSLEPGSVYGEHGDACIEVHHARVMVSEMDEGHATTLEDLQCLCANCHRVEHRRLQRITAAPSGESRTDLGDSDNELRKVVAPQSFSSA